MTKAGQRKTGEGRGTLEENPGKEGSRDRWRRPRRDSRAWRRGPGTGSVSIASYRSFTRASGLPSSNDIGEREWAAREEAERTKGKDERKGPKRLLVCCLLREKETENGQFEVSFWDFVPSSSFSFRVLLSPLSPSRLMISWWFVDGLMMV